MATWSELSRESLKAAGAAMRSECYRSSVSRAYYAAYAAVAGALCQRSLQFADDRLGPSHAQLGSMVCGNLSHLSQKQRREIARKLRFLYESRLDADYRPTRSVDLPAARNAMAYASFVAGRMGVIA